MSRSSNRAASEGPGSGSGTVPVTSGTGWTRAAAAASSRKGEPAGRIAGLGNAVGVEQQAVAVAQRDQARRHQSSARSSRPSGGAGEGSMNAAEPPRSRSGGG